MLRCRGADYSPRHGAHWQLIFRPAGPVIATGFPILDGCG